MGATSSSRAAQAQESFYGADADYRRGSPHLEHPALHDWLVGLVSKELESLAAAGRPLTVLEVGAGHGGFTAPLLASGCEVTAVEMSSHSARRLARRFAFNDRLQVVHDPAGDLTGVGGRHSLVLAAAVLHHIPDYVEALGRWADLVAPGGSLVTLQDPLWYPRTVGLAHRLDSTGFLLWRLGQGNYRAGLRTRMRRLRGVYDESEAGDMVEYHVVRQGVDELAVQACLGAAFAEVEIVAYWSHQSAVVQRIGSRTRRLNTFAAVARARSEPGAG